MARKFLSVGLMVFALAFLTISNVFIYPDTEGLVQIAQSDDLPAPPGPDNDTSENNANNMAEERAESGSNSLSEYLHDHSEIAHPATDAYLTHHKFHFTGKSLAVHFELNTPPPEQVIA